MSEVRRCLPVAIGIVVLASPRIPAQTVATLDRPDATSASAFLRVGAVRELRDGRVLVLDTGEGKLFLIDAAWSSVRQFGRNGNGPGEYAVPVRLMALGDSTAVRDWGNSRLLVIAPNGEPAGTLRDRQPADCSGQPFQFGAYHSADANGRWYLEAAPAEYRAGRPPRPVDSSAIVRWSEGCRADTIAYVPNRWGKAHTTVLPNGPVTANTSWERPPFDAQTAWTVAPNGRLAIVRPNPYRVDFVEPDGRRVDGDPIPYARVRVDDDMKRQWREDGEAVRPVMMLTRDGRSGTRMMKGPPVREPSRWPEYLPPFLQESGDFAQEKSAARFDPGGRLWIRRTTRLDERPLYDVIDASGRLVRQVRLRPRSHVIGFGQGTVIVVRVDDDESQHLERYRLP